MTDDERDRYDWLITRYYEDRATWRRPRLELDANDPASWRISWDRPARFYDGSARDAVVEHKRAVAVIRA